MRSYVLHPYQMVKDLRTEHEIGNTAAVLDGEIDGFIEAGIRWRKQAARQDSNRRDVRTGPERRSSDRPAAVESAERTKFVRRSGRPAVPGLECRASVCQDGARQRVLGGPAQGRQRSTAGNRSLLVRTRSGRGEPAGETDPSEDLLLEVVSQMQAGTKIRVLRVMGGVVAALAVVPWLGAGAAQASCGGDDSCSTRPAGVSAGATCDTAARAQRQDRLR